jgi:hypothetical protein
VVWGNFFSDDAGGVDVRKNAQRIPQDSKRAIFFLIRFHSKGFLSVQGDEPL